jgi:hypothetical protein
MERSAVLAIAIRSMCGGLKPTASMGDDPKTVVDGWQRSMIPEPVFGRSGTFPTAYRESDHHVVRVGAADRRRHRQELLSLKN